MSEKEFGATTKEDQDRQLEAIKDINVNFQLNNIVNILKGELVRQTIIDSSGNESKRIIINYKEDE